MNLEDFESVQRWLTKLRKKADSPNTRKSYLMWLRRFCEYTGMTPDEIIEERRSNLESPDENVRRRAEERLDKWFTELPNLGARVKGLSRNSCKQGYEAIRSFYKANYRELKVDAAPSTWLTKTKPGLTREDLGRLVENADLPMHRAYILCQTQSGLGISDLLGVLYGKSLEEGSSVQKHLENGSDYVHLKLLRGKEKQQGFFDTFFGRMATEALRKYLSTREGLKPTSQLFPCTAWNVNKFLRKLSSHAALGWNVSSHDLRKYFNTTLKLARVNDPAFNDSLIEYWQGHSLGKVRGAYFIPPVEEQLRLYKLAERRLEPVFDDE